MRAIVRQQTRTSLGARPVPRRASGWVRLRVLLAGICRTDVHAAEGLLSTGGSRILGHEMAGEVEEADPGSGFECGDRVTVSPLLACGTCAGCARASRCAEPKMLGVDVDGAFAEEVVVPVGSVHRVPRGLSLRRAAYVEPMAATLSVVCAPIRTDQRGLVLGAGRIADLTTRVLRHLGFALGHAEPRGRAPAPSTTSSRRSRNGRRRWTKRCTKSRPERRHRPEEPPTGPRRARRGPRGEKRRDALRGLVRLLAGRDPSGRRASCRRPPSATSTPSSDSTLRDGAAPASDHSGRSSSSHPKRGP